MKQATGGGAPGTGEREKVAGNVRGKFGRESLRDFESSLKPHCGSTSSATATGDRLSSSRTPRPIAASFDACGGGNDESTAGKEEPSPHRSNFSPDSQRCRKADNNNSSSTSIRRKSTGLDHSQHQTPSLSPLERGDGVQGMSRNLTQLRRGDGGKGKGGAGGGGAYGRAASMQRESQAISNTGFRRASVPSGREAGGFAQVSPAGKRLANAAASLTAAAEAAAARDTTSLDAWKDIAAAGEVRAGGGGWTFGGRTQGDYLLQQRARGGGKQASRR